MRAAEDTIVAVSSGQARSAISIVRASGPKSAFLLEQVCGRRPPARRTSFARLRDPLSNETIDQAVVVWFDGPRTATGEEVAEFHVHGSRAVVSCLLGVLTRFPNVRLAEPGEFTRRAFLNGVIDLAGAESLSDLISSETELQRRQALRTLDDGIGSRAEGWRARLIQVQALMEATIDFSDEADIPDHVWQDMIDTAGQLVADMTATLSGAQAAKRVREGFSVVLAGPVNAGKSTLINTIAQRDVAIVSDMAGTTRDVVEVFLDLDGIPVILADTAGQRDSADPVEREGVRRARNRMALADVIVWLEAPDTESGPLPNLSAHQTLLRVRSKADLSVSGTPEYADIYLISAHDGQGIEALLQAIHAALAYSVAQAEAAVVTHARQHMLLEEAVGALERLLSGAREGSLAPEFAAEEARLAAAALGRITGRAAAEDVLDAVFSTFCIGK